jgi:16S rRNA G966 N2-methylase RsmD
MSDKRKYFPEETSVDMDKLQINAVGEYSITCPYAANLVSSHILKVLAQQKSDETRKNKGVIIDATACVGGDSISFAKHFSKVISVEKDKTRFEMLSNNVKVYNLDKKVLPINADFIELLTKSDALPQEIDMVYIDPPWNPPGQRWHTKIKQLMLYMSEIPIYKVVESVIEKLKPRIVVLKVPNNFDMHAFMWNSLDKMVSVHHVTKAFSIITIVVSSCP